MSDVIAIVSPGPIRRLFGVIVMAALGGLLVWMALITAPSFGWRIVLLAFGGLALWGTVRLWQSTQHYVEMTEDGLRDTSGRELAAMDQIIGIDRGVFAFKPSNGFTLKLASDHSRGWAPGLWWRTSRRLGIGGVTGAGQAKFMAELLAARIAARDRTD